MQVITPSQALQMEPGTPIPAMKGKVTAVFNRSQGSNDRGPWSFQDVKLADSQGEIKLKLKNLPSFPFKKGDVVYLTGERGQKGWRGLLRNQNDYQGRVTEQVEISKGATWTKTPGAGSEGGQPSTSAPAVSLDPHKLLSHLGAMLKRCTDCAAYVIETSDKLPPDDLRELATTLFIEMNRKGVDVTKFTFGEPEQAPEAQPEEAPPVDDQPPEATFDEAPSSGEPF